MDLTWFAEYRDNMPLNSVRLSGLRKNPSFEVREDPVTGGKTRVQGK